MSRFLLKFTLFKLPVQSLSCALQLQIKCIIALLLFFVITVSSYYMYELRINISSLHFCMAYFYFKGPFPFVSPYKHNHRNQSSMVYGVLFVSNRAHKCPFWIFKTLNPNHCREVGSFIGRWSDMYRIERTLVIAGLLRNRRRRDAAAWTQKRWRCVLIYYTYDLH